MLKATMDERGRRLWSGTELSTNLSGTCRSADGPVAVIALASRKGDAVRRSALASGASEVSPLALHAPDSRSGESWLGPTARLRLEPGGATESAASEFPVAALSYARFRSPNSPGALATELRTRAECTRIFLPPPHERSPGYNAVQSAAAVRPRRWHPGARRHSGLESGGRSRSGGW